MKPGRFFNTNTDISKAFKRDLKIRGTVHPKLISGIFFLPVIYLDLVWLLFCGNNGNFACGAKSGRKVHLKNSTTLNSLLSYHDLITGANPQTLLWVVSWGKHFLSFELYQKV